MLRNVSFALIRGPFASSVPAQALQGMRFLYTAEALGLDGFANSRERTAIQFSRPQMKEKFLARMQELINSDSTNLIFTDDLKTILNIATSSPDELVILNEMIKRFQGQSSGLRFGSFTFGPVIMRFFHFSERPLDAVALLKDQTTVAMFDQFISYQIVMDLLLEKNMYKEVLEVFELSQQRNIQGNRFPKNCFIIAMAALYRMNTPEAYEKMLAYLQEANIAGHVPMRRVLTYACGLALNQNESASALNIVANCRQQNYVTVRNIKLLSYAKQGRFDDVCAILRSCVDNDVPGNTRKRSFFKDVINSVSSLVNECVSKETQLEFARLHKIISERGLVENQNLNEALETPIERLEKTDRDTWQNSSIDRTMVNASFNQQRQRFVHRNENRPLYPSRRVGLGEME